HFNLGGLETLEHKDHLVIQNTTEKLFTINIFSFSSCLLSPSTSSSSQFLQTLCKETSKIKDQQELKTLSEKEDSVGERRLCRRKT
ncbi:unnamed protein product, partial [Brassica rapa]